jgi:hypothetical protein
MDPSCQSVYVTIVARQIPGKRRYCGNECTRNSRKIVGRVGFYAVRVVSQESPRVCLCIPLSLRGIVGSVVFYEVCVVSRKAGDSFFPELLVCVLSCATGVPIGRRTAGRIKTGPEHAPKSWRMSAGNFQPNIRVMDYAFRRLDQWFLNSGPQDYFCLPIVKLEGKHIILNILQNLCV